MMRVLIVVILLLIPTTSSIGQPYNFNPDSLQAFIDKKRSCGGFQGKAKAEAHYKALQIIMNDNSADPHGLDQNNNGSACDGQTNFNRILDYDGYVIRTKEVVHSIRCPAIGINDWINLQDWSQKINSAPLQQVDYLLTQNEAECVDTVYEVFDNSKPVN